MTYWHLQMYLPEGKDGVQLNSKDMLKDPKPMGVIGVSEWNNPQCRKFKSGIQIGDIVFVREGNTAIALCEVTDNNFTDEKLTEKYTSVVNFRHVKVLQFASEKIQPRSGLFSQGTLTRCANEDTEQCRYIKSWYNEIIKNMEISKTIKLLKKKKNIILQGAPGTGKTYNTAAIAVGIVDGVEKTPSKHSDLMKRYQELHKSGQIDFCTFHQSFDYEDFVEGLKPKVNGSNVEYIVEPGIFKRMCKRAQTNERLDNYDKNITEKPYVLIIDEINRGNVSRIFGELITLLEADKRSGSHEHELSVILPYSKEIFSVPVNLYIIGTMNTTDRSTGTIDYAIRRRFAFVTLEAERDVVASQNSKVRDKAVALFDSVKSYIDSQKMSDIDLSDLMVGHSYFLADDEDDLQLKMEYEVIPLIGEYMKDGILKDDKNKDRYFSAWKKLSTEIEEESNQD